MLKKTRSGEIVTLPAMELIKFVWSFVTPYKAKFFVAVFFRFLGDLVWLYPAYALAEIVNFLIDYEKGSSLEHLWWLTGFWFIAVFIRPVAQNIGKYHGYRIGERCSLDLQYSTYQHLLQLNIDWHEKENTGNKLEKIRNGGEAINGLVRLVFDYLIEIVVNFVGMIYIFSLFDINISLMIIAFGIFYFFMALSLSKKAAKASYLSSIEWEKLSGSAFEAINNIHTVKLLQMRENLLAVISSRIKVLFKKISTRIFWYRTRQILTVLSGEIFRVSLVVFIAWGIIEGRYEVGFLVLFFGYFNRVWDSIDELASVSDMFTYYTYSIQRTLDIRNEPITIEDNKGKQKAPKNWQKLEIKNLSFQYGNTKVFKKLNLDIRKGEKIGIVGLSGGGKSTLFKLLLKQYENYDGQILLDGLDLKAITKSSYLNLTAVVPQETELFNLPLDRNISLAKPKTQKINQKQLQRAIDIAHIKEFLPKLTNGLKTLVGEKGVKLSGGEKQRVGIARAVYREPEILFLDEATSHLDIESERNIQAALHTFFQEVTAIVIAHRLSTIKEMDRIIVLEKGQITEQGSFKTLMKQKGRFFELWEKQLFD